MYTRIMYATTLCMMLVSWKEGFIEYTVNVYARALNLKQSVHKLVVGVQICCLDQYTSYGVVNIYDKFQGCTFDVQAATGI